MLADLIVQFASGDFTARGIPGEDGDSIDQAVQAINHLADKLQQQHMVEAQAEQRANEILTVMMNVAACNYAHRVPLHDEDTIFEGLAAGLNMLIDEIVAAQDEQTRLQEEVIRPQAETIQELSTPLIPISDDVLIMPLIGALDSSRMQQILERLLVGIQETHARYVIIDITGIVVVDTQVANALIQAAQAVRLLGAQVIITGIRPEVSQTMVGLGISLSNIVTHSTLQTGIAYTMRQPGGTKARR